MSVSKNKSQHIAVQPSLHKLEALRELSKLGLKLSDGYDYNLYEYVIPESSLEETRQRLSSIKEPLSHAIVEERQK